MSAPTFEQLAALPVARSFVVGPEHLDENGHMNVNHYFAQGSEASWDRSRHDLGIDETYIAERHHSTFTAEQHIRYFDECVLGDSIDIPVVWVDRTDKAVHVAAFVVNTTKQRLACVVEALEIHVDFKSRRPAPFPADVVERLDAAIEADRVAWDLPLSGGVRIRH